MTLEEALKEHDPLIRSLANKMHANTMFSKEDLYQIGRMAFIRAYPKFDKKKSKITTFLGTCAKRDMIKFIQKSNRNCSSQLRSDIPENDDDDIRFEIDDFKNTPYFEVVKLISEGKTEVFIKRNLKISDKKLIQIKNAIRNKLTRMVNT